MQSLSSDLYAKCFQAWDMVPATDFGDYGPAGELYRVANKAAEGEYWVYFRENLFAVNSFELVFHEKGEMRMRHLEHLSIGYYECSEGTEWESGNTPQAGSLAAYIGHDGDEYAARFEAGALYRATSITLSPDYYRSYLQQRFGTIPDLQHAFALVDGRQDCPDVAALFKRIRDYRGCGVAADLFYEGAVAEAVGLVMRHAAEIEEQSRSGEAGDLAPEDRAALASVAAFIDDHLDGNLTCATLAREACMGQTKFKAAFRICYGISPAAYVADRRMEHALELISSTDAPIAAIARSVGYRKPGAFAKAFQRHTGVLPSALRLG